MRLAEVILWRIAESPTTIGQLIRWVRIQWPRILPDAVGMAVCGLRRAGFVDIDGEHWHVSQGRGAPCRRSKG